MAIQTFIKPDIITLNFKFLDNFEYSRIILPGLKRKIKSPPRKNLRPVKMKASILIILETSSKEEKKISVKIR
jgi:hypothetical protein